MKHRVPAYPVLLATARHALSDTRTSERALAATGKRKGFRARVLGICYRLGFPGFLLAALYALTSPLQRFWYFGGILVADHASRVVRNSLGRNGDTIPNTGHQTYRIKVFSRLLFLSHFARVVLSLRRIFTEVAVSDLAGYAALTNLLHAYVWARAAVKSAPPTAIVIALTSDRRRLALGVVAEVSDIPLGVFLVDRHGTTRHLPFRAEALFCWTHKQQHYYQRYAGEVVVMPSPLQPIRPAPQKPTAGVLLNARVNVKELRGFLERLRERHGLRNVQVRPHPGFDATKLTDLGDAVIRDWKQPLGEFLDELDLAFGPNTNALMDAVMHGVPTVYVGGLDPYDYDLHGYVADGVVLAYDPEHRYPERANEFYQSEAFARAWEEVGYQADGSDEARALRRLLKGGHDAPR